jgi:hypothetical protein
MTKSIWLAFLLSLNSVFALCAVTVNSEVDLYLKARQQFLQVYSPLIKEFTHVDLKLELSEDAPDEAASVSWLKENVLISIGSEFQTISKISPDGYLGVLCHEVGHILGGEPRKSRLGPERLWYSSVGASVEGQSDYYSANVCLKKIFLIDTDETPISSTLPSEIQTMCQSEYQNQKDINICLRTIAAGYAWLSYYADLFQKFGVNQYMRPPKFLEKEKPGVSNSKEYPSLQCRFDTILNGALNKERPNCWFPYFMN